MTKRLVLSAAIGIVMAFAFLGVSVYVEDLGFESLAKVFLWPNGLLQLLAPPHNIGTPEHVVLEGSPLNDLAFTTSVPLAALVYGAIAFFILPRVKRVP